MSLDNVLKKNTNDLNKELEVDRVIRAFKLNPYDILDVRYTATEKEIKQTFRKKSLLIHPDKFQHERGPEAFDRLKKAEAQLSDPISRKEIDSMVKHARIRVLKTLIPVGYDKVTDDDERLQNLTPSLDLQIRHKVKEVLVEEELAKKRKHSVQAANEGAEKERLAAEVAARKRKAEEQVKWEERREERVQGWRAYQKKPKKEKKNTHVLG